MSMNLSQKLDELQTRGDRQLETTVALCEIRTQLQELTKSVESCQSEVSEVKRDMVVIKQELDTVQQVKEEIEELREYVDRLEEHTHRRKLRLLEQVTYLLSYIRIWLHEGTFCRKRTATAKVSVSVHFLWCISKQDVAGVGQLIDTESYTRLRRMHHRKYRIFGREV